MVFKQRTQVVKSTVEPIVELWFQALSICSCVHTTTTTTTATTKRVIKLLGPIDKCHAYEWMWINKNAPRNISAHVRRSSTAYMSRYNLIKPFVCIIAVVHEIPLLLSATTRPCSTLASQLVFTQNCRFASNFFPLEFQLIKWIFSYSCVIFFSKPLTVTMTQP